MDGGVIDGHAALGHHLFDVTQAQGVGCVPTHADQHHLQRVVQPPDHFAQFLDHRDHPVVGIGSACQYRLTATEPNRATRPACRCPKSPGRASRSPQAAEAPRAPDLRQPGGERRCSADRRGAAASHTWSWRPPIARFRYSSRNLKRASNAGIAMAPGCRFAYDARPGAGCCPVRPAA